MAPPIGVSYFQKVLGYGPLQEIELPEIDESDIIRCSINGRSGKKPELIDERHITGIKNFFMRPNKSQAP